MYLGDIDRKKPRGNEKERSEADGLRKERERRSISYSYLLNSANSSHYLHIDFKCKQMNEVVTDDVCIHWHYIRALLALSSCLSLSLSLSLFVKVKTSNIHTKSNNAFCLSPSLFEKIEEGDQMITTIRSICTCGGRAWCHSMYTQI